MADFLDNIVSAWGDDEVGEEDAYPDETAAPNVNILIRTARRFLDKKVEQEEFLDEVYQTLDRLEQALAEHRSHYQNSELTPELRGLAEKADDAYEEFRGGLVEMEKADVASVRHGIEVCKEATFNLVEANQAFLEHQQREQMVECLMCGHLNTPNLSACIKCNATLPKTMVAAAASANTSGTSDLIMVPKEYVDLYEACDKVAADEIALEDWQRHIDFFNDRFNQASQQIHDQVRSHQDLLESIPNLVEEADEVVESLDQALEALAEMQLFANDGDPEHLNQGWMALMLATQKIQHTTLAFYQTLESAQESDG